LQREGRFPGALNISTIDGVRADYADGFGLARPSNTTPCVVLRFEGADAAALARVQAEFRAALLALDASLKLPF
jgi:phosphomannomutase/phosphoglucomutase